MTARRIVLATLAIGSLTIGIYAQGGRAQGGAATVQAQGGGQRGGGGGAAGRQAGPMGSGNLIEGAWGSAPLPVDSRGWGWMSKSYLSPNARRPLYNQAKEELFQNKKVTSVTISSFNPEQYCEARKHWDYV